MKMEHIIVEGYCDGSEKQTIYPCNGVLKMGTHCLTCSKFSYTYCPNEITISNADGLVEEYIGFGGNMEPNDTEKRNEYILLWNKICKEKIEEAFEEFMRQIKK